MFEKKLKKLSVDEIHPYARNPRNNADAVEAVVASIRQCKYVAPIIVDENGEILAGHTRFEALKRMGEKEIEVLWVDGLSYKQKRKYRLLDNKTNEFAEWDFDLLAEELDDLDFDDFDFGFDLDIEHENIIDEESEVKEVDAPEVDRTNNPVSKLGDIWMLGRHRLMCGDSASSECVQKLMGGAQADLLLTDPPYGVNYTGKTKDALKIENDAKNDDEFVAFLRSAFESADSVMKQGAVFYIWHADSKGYIFRTACHMIGWEIRQCLIWVKNSMVLGRQDYQWKHEPCLYGWKSGAGHLWASDRKQTTVLEFDKPLRSTEHPTMKPVALFDYQIKNNTKGGDIVLDLFAGSGTTVVACEQNGRIAYVMEYDPKYCDVIIKRWESLTGEKAVRIVGA